MGWRKKNNQGLALIGIIIVIVLLAIVALGIVTYIVHGLGLNIIRINQDKALYMAQAGIMRAIVDYKDGGLWSPAQDVSVGGEFYYHVGQDANFLWVDASKAEIDGKKLRNIPIKNINSVDKITITDMIVSWSFRGNIEKVKLGDKRVWRGGKSSPATLDIEDFTITPDTSHTGKKDQQWNFSRNVSGDVVVTFIFSDGSRYKAILLQSGTGGNMEFSITATGEVRRGTVVGARRTLAATYDTGTNKITSWQEPQSHIMP